ncbi:hypothetical protein PHISCL_09038 [Aspergillus sclerotialis]|uniref:Uncharacterized protein n=1 Tax=Aspergillus sclerotialis TaxID=2070753 RepID=A0A3A2Z6B6_9EURO|nr:hypothetical protein PHISCL_09038 [Aspergillus sclerotialis]
MSAILSQCQRLENKMKELQSEMRELKYEMIELISRTSLDKTRIKALENSCFGFRATRNSFISAAKRDIFGTATHEDHVMIAASVRYGIPNFGYAEFDAGLYRNGARKDFAAYERLYGLHPDVVRSIGEILLFRFGGLIRCLDVLT